MDLQQELGIAYLFISHNLQVVRHIADDIIVMYLGRIVEYGPKPDIFSRPAHPYTRALLASTPSVAVALRRVRAPLGGELPSPLDPPSGCAFHKRCPHAIARCAVEVPQLTAFRGVKVACIRAAELN
jgi:dipeptide transport system ATP-binding protein